MHIYNKPLNYKIVQKKVRNNSSSTDFDETKSEPSGVVKENRIYVVYTKVYIISIENILSVDISKQNL